MYMEYELNDEVGLTCSIVEALSEYRSEDYVDVPLHNEGIEIESMERMIEHNATDLSISFNYKDTNVTIKNGCVLQLRRLQKV